MRMQTTPAKAKHRVGLCPRARNCEIGSCLVHRTQQAADEIMRKKGRIARHGDHQIVPSFAESSLKAGQGTSKPTNHIGDYAVSEHCILLRIAIGINQNFRHLRSQAGNHLGDHGLAIQLDESFIDTTHAPSHSTGEDHTRDALRRQADIQRPTSLRLSGRLEMRSGCA